MLHVAFCMNIHRFVFDRSALGSRYQACTLPLLARIANKSDEGDEGEEGSGGTGTEEGDEEGDESDEGREVDSSTTHVVYHGLVFIY